MGSSKDSASSLAIGQIGGMGSHVSADSGNSEMMVRRKVRMSWKQLRASFRDVEDEEQRVSTENVRQILKRFDIDITDGQFSTMKEKAKAAVVNWCARSAAFYCLSHCDPYRVCC